MSRGVSQEEKLIEYYHNAPLEAVKTMLLVGKSIVAKREAEPQRKPTQSAPNGGISAATRKKISATLKAKNAAKRASTEALPPGPLNPQGLRPKPRQTGGGMEPRILG